MRLFTRAIEPNVVQHSYYVTFLLWIGQKLFNHGESISHRHFES